MNITKEQIDNLNAVVRIKLSPEDYASKVEKTLRDHSKKVSMPGFRPGKVPFGMVKKMYGKTVMAEEINKILSESLYSYLQENKIEILGNPLPRTDEHIDWDNQKEFEFSYDLGLLPEFSVNLDKMKKFDFQTVKVDEDLINKQIEDIRKRYGKMGSPEISNQNDVLFAELVELDENGNVKENGIAKSSTIVLDRMKDEQTKTKLTGLKLEDTISVDPKKLSENSTDLAAMLGVDKTIAEQLNTNFQLTVKNISRIEPSEINQEMFDKVYGQGTVTTEEEFRTKVAQDISAMFQGDVDNKLFNEISSALIDNTAISLPDEFLKRWMQTVSEKPVTIEQIEAEYDKYAKGLKWQLIENKLIKEYKIEVSHEEVLAFTKEIIKDQFARYGRMNMSDEELSETAKRIMENKEEIKRIYERIYDKKMLDLFKETIPLNEKPVSIDEFYESANKA
ncbi:MAG: trigger factor [Bacteroidetes bacterium]|nr:trigger factor [Bacteroidota bacterium]HET6243498.1 trigger factor [Bacteroidia bacterium]